MQDMNRIKRLQGIMETVSMQITCHEYVYKSRMKRLIQIRAILIKEINRLMGVDDE